MTFMTLYTNSFFCRVAFEAFDMHATKCCWKLWKIKGNYVQVIMTDDSFFPVNNNLAQYATHAYFLHSHEFLLMLRLQHQHSRSSLFTLCLKTSSHPQVIVYNNFRHSAQQIIIKIGKIERWKFSSHLHFVFYLAHIVYIYILYIFFTSRPVSTVQVAWFATSGYLNLILICCKFPSKHFLCLSK